MPVPRGLMQRAVTVRESSNTDSPPQYVEVRWSPVLALIQSRADANGDPWFDDHLDATHRLWCGGDIGLEEGHLVSWREEDGNTTQAVVVTATSREEGDWRTVWVPIRLIEE